MSRVYWLVSIGFTSRPVKESPYLVLLGPWPIRWIRHIQTMEADYSRLPFPSEKKRNITAKESKKKPKTKKASQIMIPEKGQRTAIVRVVIQQFRSIDPSFMPEREK